MSSEPVPVAEPSLTDRSIAPVCAAEPRPAKPAWSKGGAAFALAVVLVVSVAFLVLSAAGDGDKWRGAIGRVHPGLVVVLLVLALASFSARALRFQWFARAVGIDVPTPWMFLCYFAGFSLAATPGKVGEFMRLWLIRSRYGYSISRSMPLQIADRLNDAVASFILCAIGAAAFAGYLPVLLFGACLVGLGILAFAYPALLLGAIGQAYRLFAKRPRLFAGLRRMVRLTAALFSPRVFLPSIALSVLGWGLECVAFALCLTVVVGVFDPLLAMFILEFSNVVGFASLMPGGTGMTELSLSGLMVASGVGLEDAVIVTVIIRAATLWFSILVGIAAAIVLARLDGWHATSTVRAFSRS
ncbi:lysylphosphatidylglycerol synthase transmembrane domain-containing protein [Xanthobacteraceae bacterium Astr-EGSB]|uniref:lysylphosphatidylglycerol synthase transmembrane domain-containing protein n=1 Tax=Astrobacterium formosum TaxID=3069710 RepID=UPI0027B3C993|nr:lysylphosphatidylglycerol synthase transmembrane domain-containing protein [Xanthobacteraceae bacterium Astr-EGSB]